MENQNGYVGFYKDRRAECHADTKLEAQQKLAKMLKAKHGYDVSVVLASKDGKPVVHTAT